MLEVQNLSMRFGGLLAVDQVSLDVQEHEIVLSPSSAPTGLARPPYSTA